jgi:predicted homoserine dehydrogenase-like protein
MNLYSSLKQRAAEDKPIRIGLIGAGKFGTMFLSQARITPGMQMVGIAELDLDKARHSCISAGWPQDTLAIGSSTAAINEGARRKKVILTEDANQLIDSALDVILEVTGIPEAGTLHAWKALQSGKHVIMVTVEADALLGKALAEQAKKCGMVYSLAYGDQPALICEQIDWARTAGLEVVCAGKGTHYQPEYHYSTPDTVWKNFGFSEERIAAGNDNAKMFNSFLDGTKSAVEMCAVANATNLIPQKRGLQFLPVGVNELADKLKPISAGGTLEHSGTVEVIAGENRDGTPVKGELQHGVYTVFKAPSSYVKRCFSEYGLHTDSSGEYTALYRPFHLIGIELGISVASAVIRGEPTGSFKSLQADVASVAKKDLKPGDVLDGEGGYTVYGRLAQAKESISKGYLAMGLTNKAKVLRPVARDSILTYKDVALDETLFSYKIRKRIEEELENAY